jgi:class 3 adenylate cyclase
MNIFDSYSQRVRNAFQQERLSKGMTDDLSNFNGDDSKYETRRMNKSMALGLQPESSLLKLRDVVQGYDPDQAQIGLHPDFKYLKGTDNKEYHYITSVFIDIKGSTNLNDKYELETIYNITNTIQSAAIHVCLLFGGHIQRLQGDGVFVYFGGKSVTKPESAKQAVTATSMFTYFVKNDLQQIFEEEGVENISTRIGIDFGDDRDVLWGNFGVGQCIELTTLSLHTSLAPKMQSHAGKNGIVVGQNVKDQLMIDETYFDYVRNSKGEITERYIYIGRKKNIYYTQYKFNWFDYLKSLPYISVDSEGNLFVLPKEQQEQDRLSQLRSTAGIISSGNAFTDSRGNISSNTSGIKNQGHRFHYE